MHSDSVALPLAGLRNIDTFAQLYIAQKLLLVAQKLLLVARKPLLVARKPFSCAKLCVTTA